MSASGGNPQLQELAEQLEALEQHQEALKTEIESLKTEKVAVGEAIDAIEALETGDTVQMPLGGGAHVQATVDDIDQVTVELGADYAAERDQDGAIDTLSSKQETIDDRIEEVREEIADVESETDQLRQRAEQLQSQQLQQQQSE
jgi:prefoldin alpha subunit